MALGERSSLVALFQYHSLTLVARKSTLKQLQTRICYQFAKADLLQEALTHASATYGQPHIGDYQRLEFLGDRVLGLAIAEQLYQRFPSAPEGELAIRLNALVKKETCAAVARELDIGPHIILGDSEALAGGRRKETILADICEALLGAVYLDGGWEAGRNFVKQHWTTQVALELAKPVDKKDPKTALQEWVQGGQTKAKIPPRYALVDNSGPDHAPSFVYEVRVEGFEPERGTGSSRKAAEQAAAAALLKREGVWKADNE
jgi:ribonuclease III